MYKKQNKTKEMIMMIKHIKFDTMGDDVYYILERDGKLMNATKIEIVDGEINEFDVRHIKREEGLPFYIQYRFIEGRLDYLLGVTESYIESYPLDAKKSDRYRMILTRCPDEWLDDDEIEEWL